MAQDHGRAHEEDNVVVLRATPEEFRDEPVGGPAAQVAPLRGPVVREEPVTAGPAATMEDEQAAPRWRRPALALVGLVPLAALAVPAVRRPLARALPAGTARVNAAWQAGSRQVASATQTATGQIAGATQSATGQITNAKQTATGQVASVWRRRQEQREQVDRARVRETERQAELLVERLSELNRVLAERNRPRGGLFRRVRPVLLGLVLGGGLGLLYAPRPGAAAPARQQGQSA